MIHRVEWRTANCGQMKESRFWIIVFVFVVIIGISAILLQLLLPSGAERVLIDGYRLLSIFLGVLAGVALGEYFKIRNNQRAGNVLQTDLIEELRTNHGLLEEDVPLRKGFWILGIRSGIVRYLDEKVRRDLWNIYSNITHYNEEFQVYHSAELAQNKGVLTPSFTEELNKLRDLIRSLLVEFFQTHSIEL